MRWGQLLSVIPSHGQINDRRIDAVTIPAWRAKLLAPTEREATASCRGLASEPSCLTRHAAAVRQGREGTGGRLPRWIEIL
jgi:hypothetical protein